MPLSVKNKLTFKWGKIRCIISLSCLICFLWHLEENLKCLPGTTLPVRSILSRFWNSSFAPPPSALWAPSRVPSSFSHYLNTCCSHDPDWMPSPTPFKVKCFPGFCQLTHRLLRCLFWLRHPNRSIYLYSNLILLFSPQPLSDSSAVWQGVYWYLSVYVSMYVSVSVSVYVYVYMSVCMCLCMLVYVYVCVYLYLSVFYVCMSS